MDTLAFLVGLAMFPARGQTLSMEVEGESLHVWALLSGEPPFGHAMDWKGTTEEWHSAVTSWQNKR
jgi:hypothetical protein